MKIHLISHTHWDREWYLPFQEFRLRLVHLMDNLLDLLEHDPAYRYFMLDGQTIVLDDYLQMRPEREAEIRAYVEEGRLLIGPWHILPDEFLVSPEATLRNLLQGERTARRFGAKMPVGYIPDPFGHIGQMPQILRGFGIDAACVQRGLSDEPAEFWWQAPDGSQVFMAYLRDGYGNAAGLPVEDPQRFVSEVQRLRDSLAPHTASSGEASERGGHLLFMQGTDHMEPPAGTPQAISYANQHLEKNLLVHSTLPAYLQEIRSDLEDKGVALPTVTGELRSSKRFHLLPGVLSSRMWIKQRNHTCEALLEKWVEPFTAWAAQLQQAPEHERYQTISRTSPLVRHAWRLLMENHPHDSICGCSIDQVHAEMRPRFDQVEQIGETLTIQSLQTVADAADTRPPAAVGKAFSAVIVFNPSSGPVTGWVESKLILPDEINEFEIVDESGTSLPHQVHGHASRELFNTFLDREGLASTLSPIQYGRVGSYGVQKVTFTRSEDLLAIEAVLDESGEPDPLEWDRASGLLTRLLDDPSLQTFHLVARTRVHRRVAFAAPEVPGWGFRTYWVRAASSTPASHASGSEPAIANEFFSVLVDRASATLTLTDLRSGAVFSGLNRFVDGGDCGDEYNYSPPSRDLLVEQAEVRNIQVLHSPGRQSIEINMVMAVPAGLAGSRASRSAITTALEIKTRATLTNGVPRLDIETQVDNAASDHRLRVHFPAPFNVSQAEYDGHYEIVKRPLDLPVYDHTWAEQPRPEVPQRAFTAVFDGEAGLLIANRGLPEVEVMRTQGGSEIALTLLRCTGWLSRDDFATRRGHAGPMIATPGAQEQGQHTFDYSVIPAANRPEGIQQAHAFNLPFRGAASRLHTGVLPSKTSMVSVSPDSFIISAIKVHEDSPADALTWLVRGYSISDHPVELVLTPWRPFHKAARSNLAEKPLSTLQPLPNGTVRLQINPNEIASVLFTDNDKIL